jgi:hypothetical protein
MHLRYKFFLLGEGFGKYQPRPGCGDSNLLNYSILKAKEKVLRIVHYRPPYCTIGRMFHATSEWHHKEMIMGPIIGATFELAFSIHIRIVI